MLPIQICIVAQASVPHRSTAHSEVTTVLLRVSKPQWESSGCEWIPVQNNNWVTIKLKVHAGRSWMTGDILEWSARVRSATVNIRCQMTQFLKHRARVYTASRERGGASCFI